MLINISARHCHSVKDRFNTRQEQEKKEETKPKKNEKKLVTFKAP